MEKIETLRNLGLFDAKVPRYTSYPPANRFKPDVGRRMQIDWLGELPIDEPLSLYVHIPFCRRLCWFCACRTQGTKSVKPVEDYLQHLLREITTLSELAPSGLNMARLHLGGGTPTLLSASQLNRLLQEIRRTFSPTDDFEFSVEVDPTEAKPLVLDALASWNLDRASIGIQDFDPRVQNAIGRMQSVEETEQVIASLREGGVKSLNVDLLYGLPHQTSESLSATIESVAAIKPDRIALYGYAHVPHMSKRQVMIPTDALPDAEQRFLAARQASDRLSQLGYQALGIDHFALPEDSLAKAALNGTLRRNFQGYTDDPCKTLIGIGASAISKFPKGFVQNAVATAAYQQRIDSGCLAGHKGYRLSRNDQIITTLVDQIMCAGEIDFTVVENLHGPQPDIIEKTRSDILVSFPDCFDVQGNRIILKNDMTEISRLVAAKLDQGLRRKHIHSSAI